MSTSATAQQPEVTVEQHILIDHALSQLISGNSSFEPHYRQQLPQYVNLRNRVADQLVRRIQAGQISGNQRLDVNTETETPMIRFALTKLSMSGGQPFSQVQVNALLSQIDEAAIMSGSKTQAATSQAGKVGG